MSRTLEGPAATPKLSFTNWILGGNLVTVPRRERTPDGRLPSGDVDKDLKPNYSFINEKRYHHNRRVSKNKATDTEKDAEKGNKNKGQKAETAKKPVPKDEIAKKEEVPPSLVLDTHYRQILITVRS